MMQAPILMIWVSVTASTVFELLINEVSVVLPSEPLRIEALSSSKKFGSRPEISPSLSMELFAVDPEGPA